MLGIATTTLPAGTVGNPYSASVAASGGRSPYRWSIAGVRGLTISGGSAADTSVGAISGTPVIAGTGTAVVSVTDGDGSTASRSYAVNITGTTVLNFDSVSVAPGGCVDASIYLGSFGITYTGPASSTPDICNDTGMCCANATSPPNFFVIDYRSQLTYSLDFSSPVSSVSFERAGIQGGSSGPQWTATAYDAQGQQVGSSVGEGVTNGPPARSFTISGPGITRLTIVSTCCFATENNPGIDDLTFSR